jgi:DnaJ family protein C protein 19
MIRLIIFLGVAAFVWKTLSGRWPWEAKVTTRGQALFRARKLLGVRAEADRGEIIDAHRRLLAMVHPDRGGTNDQVHEANAARDLLLDELPDA